ncbi:MAG: hypothetical protein LUD78_10655 [Clostridiales bacterium]|nr:hypothetical protein [Clostridiales bacterium]
MVTAFALLATGVISTHWRQMSLRTDGSVLGTVLIGSVLWLLYCVWQVLLLLYSLATHVSQVIFDHRHLLTFAATILLAMAFSAVRQVVTQENDGMYGNVEIYFGSRIALLTIGISEEQPVGRIRGKNLQECRCISEDEQFIPAGTRVQILRWCGNKVVVRPLRDKDA